MWSYDCNGTVSWDSTGFFFDPDPNTGGIKSWFVSIPGMGASENPNELIEVIGNIYEKPKTGAKDSGAICSPETGRTTGASTPLSEREEYGRGVGTFK
jgi:hypothetical protein